MRARRDQGLAEWTGPDGRSVSCHTVTCCHCNDVTVIPPGAAADDCGGFCTMCMLPTCRACAGKSCAPFEKQLEAIEARGRMLKAIGV